MARDVNLQLISGATAMAGTGAKGSVVDTEGGFYALVSMLLGTCTGTTSGSICRQDLVLNYLVRHCLPLPPLSVTLNQLRNTLGQLLVNSRGS